MARMRRRDFLNLTAMAAGGAFLTARVAFGNVSGRKARLVVVIMRGALDGLAAVPPYADSDYAGLRREVALRAAGAPGGALPLNGFFGLHPSLAFMQQCYAARELTVFHAVASPYRDRSHFDGQNVLETGGTAPYDIKDGWMNRLITMLPKADHEAIAFAPTVPMALRGPAQVTS